MEFNEENVILRMKGITKRFPGTLALDHVQLTCERGKVHILLGENGAGKSTLVKIISGAITLISGLFNVILGVIVVLAVIALVVWMFRYAAKHK